MDRLVITTTDTHLPRRIGEALSHAYHGTLDLQYADEDQLIRVNWTRSARLEEYPVRGVVPVGASAAE